jgi:GDP-4-dehydro-6-deoxy-D-mannose reductase
VKPKHYLITGGRGFVGTVLTRRLVERGHRVSALDLRRCPPAGVPCDGCVHLEGDLLDQRFLENAFAELPPPDGVFHLAAQASVGLSWRQPARTYHVNVVGTACLVDVLKRPSPPPRLVLVSSGEVYGCPSENVRLDESRPLLPVNPYGMSKFFAERLSSAFYPDTVIARPFGILGPGQNPAYAVPGFVEKIAAMVRKGASRVLQTGNLEVVRNFVDVEDAVSAYTLLMDKGDPGKAYNIAAAESISLKDLLERLREISGIDFDIRTDPSRLRPVEPRFDKVDSTRIRRLGWRPGYPLASTLKRMLEARP